LLTPSFSVFEPEDYSRHTEKAVTDAVLHIDDEKMGATVEATDRV
jgi:hypothetical protein